MTLSEFLDFEELNSYGVTAPGAVLEEGYVCVIAE